MSKASIKDISDLTGVSPATVSKALNHREGVSQETASRIIEAARKLGYKKHEKLANVTFVLARKTGRIVNDSAFYSLVVQGIEQRASQLGIQTMFMTLDMCNNPQFEKQVADLASDLSVGITLLGSELNSEDLHHFVALHDNLVVLETWSDIDPFDTILIENEESFRRILDYLARRGHRRIGHLAGDHTIENFRQRSRGFIRGIQELGLGDSEPVIVHTGASIAEARSDIAKWLATDPIIPTAFVADNDAIAAGALQAFTEVGLKVPEDISLVGFDNSTIAELTTPGLTTVDVPKHAFGQLAFQMLMEKSTDSFSFTRRVEVGTTLVERGSVRSI